MNILYIYKWATMGGVERVILNRVHCLKANNRNVKTDVYFLEDFGGVTKMTDYINFHNLQENLSIVKNLNPKKYDVIISIDTPEVFEKLKDYPIVVECHTIYKENRRYLESLPSNVVKVVFPSLFFCNDVKLELKNESSKFFVLPNFVPNIEPYSFQEHHIIYNKTPILYTGRIDYNKNALEIIDVVSKANAKYGDRFVVIFASAVLFSMEKFQEYLIEKKMDGRVIFIPNVSFHNINSLIQLVKIHKGIFMSSSKGETFGMSVAEAMSFDIPVLLSDIKAHRSLVNNDSDFLYSLNNIKEGAKKLILLSDNWEDKSNKIISFKTLFNPEVFIKSWDKFIDELIT